MGKSWKFSLLILSIIFLISGCTKKVETSIDSMQFKDLEYYINEEVYFSVKEGIYKNHLISFKNMKLVLKEGYTILEEGIFNLKDLTIKSNHPIDIYIKDLVIQIKKDPRINLREMRIEGYDVIIRNTKKKEKISEAYKINIDINNYRVYTYQNKGRW